MKLFSCSSSQEGVFLALLSKNLEVGEWDRLQHEGGFREPNCFEIEAFKRILEELQFPRTSFYEYQWAIYECGVPRLLRYSAWMQTFLSSVYLYCNKRQQWGIEIQSDYFYVMASLNTDGQGPVALWEATIQFLEWLYECVKPGQGYRDYYCLLTWSMLRRLSGADPDCLLERVVEILLARKYTPEEIELLTVSDRNQGAWYRLHQEIPCPEKLREPFERIILGVPPTFVR